MKDSPRSKYYVYGYFDPNSKQLFYIGKGHGNRYRHIENRKNNKRLYCSLKKLRKFYSFENFTILFKTNMTEQEAYIEEIKLIKMYGRADNATGTLLNRTSGGEGADGKIVTRYNLQRVKDGVHPFVGGTLSRINAIRRVRDGTHNFLGGEISRRINEQRVKNGTHHFLFNDGQHLNKPCVIECSDGRLWKFKNHKEAIEAGFSTTILQQLLQNNNTYTLKKKTFGKKIKIHFLKGDIITYITPP